MHGYGPTGAKALTQRPPDKPDPYGQQTWFGDATGPGKRDGTVLDATFLNRLIAERLAIVRAARVQVNSNIGIDELLLTAILELIEQHVGVAMSAPKLAAVLDQAYGAGWQGSQTAPDIVSLLDAHFNGTSWRDAGSSLSLPQGSII
jgi:hypothetical protein